MQEGGYCVETAPGCGGGEGDKGGGRKKMTRVVVCAVTFSTIVWYVVVGIISS